MTYNMNILLLLAFILISGQGHAATLVITDGEVNPARTSSPHDKKLLTGVTPSEPVALPLPTQKPSKDCTSSSPTSASEFTIMQGDILSQRLSEWARGYGYTVSWEAPELRADGGLISHKDFDGTLVEFKRAMESNGINLDVIIYENCIVRIVEVK